MGNLGTLTGLLAGAFLLTIVVIVVFVVILFLIYRQMGQIKGLLQGNNFYLMTLVQTLGERRAATRAAMHHFKLTEIEAIQFLQLLQMRFPEDDEDKDR